nr:glycosyltransferase [Endozoicomonas sp. YOMI1]
MELSLLENAGFVCENFFFDNKDITNFFESLKVIISLNFSKSIYYKLTNLLSSRPIDIAHIHNFFPLLTPSVFYACQDANVPVVHTLHNFRTLCPTATLMHNGKICERSLHENCWWTVPKRVYRNSLIGTAVLAYMVEYHKRKGTWQTQVDRYIALTEFAKNKFIEGGLPADKISVKPNFIEDPHKGIEKVVKQGGFALFVGRLSEEKGLSVLLDAWEHVKYPLKIIGDGPLKALVEKFTAECPQIEYLGFQDKEVILPMMQEADFFVLSSTCYENFPVTLAECFASGTPALVSNIGGMAEIVTDGKTGLHFEVGNPDSLAEKAEYLIQHLKEAREMGENARLKYLAKYTPGINLEMLLGIYRLTIREKKGVCHF